MDLFFFFVCFLAQIIAEASSFVFQPLNIFLQNIEHVGYVDQPDQCGPCVTNCGPLLKSSMLCNLHLPTICTGWHQQLLSMLLATKLACTLSAIVILCSRSVPHRSTSSMSSIKERRHTPGTTSIFTANHL